MKHVYSSMHLAVTLHQLFTKIYVIVPITPHKRHNLYFIRLSTLSDKPGDVCRSYLGGRLQSLHLLLTENLRSLILRQIQTAERLSRVTQLFRYARAFAHIRNICMRYIPAVYIKCTHTHTYSSLASLAATFSCHRLWIFVIHFNRKCIYNTQCQCLMNAIHTAIPWAYPL